MDQPGIVTSKPTVWTSKDGRKTAIKNLETTHLLNIIAMLDRNGNIYGDHYQALCAELESRQLEKIQNLAISMRQPWAEMVLRKDLLADYRNVPTKIRGRVYVYAPAKVLHEVGLTLPRSVLVGTVEVADCRKLSRPIHGCWFEYVLVKPQRFEVPAKPTGQPGPIWFKPFKEIKEEIE